MKNELNKEYTATCEATTLKEPALFKLVVHNDDYTPMEFVVNLLERFLYMDRRRAIAITYEAHMKGQAIAGVFSKDVAETKASQIIEYAKLYEHPFACSTEVAA